MMARIAAILIPICLLAIAGGVAVAAQRISGLTTGATVAVGLAVLFSVALIQGGLQRLRERKVVDRRQAELAAVEESLKRGFGALSSRMEALERRERGTSGATPESAVMSTITHQLAEAVAVLDQRLDRLEGRRSGGEGAPRPVALVKDSEPVREAPRRDDAKVRDDVRKAVAAGRIEFYLQPIVTLPQRRPRFYELLTRLKDEAGALILPADFRPIAAGLGLLPALDKPALLNALQVLRRLTARQREVGLFCNLSVATLADANAFAEMLDFADKNRGIADGLILEFSQAEMGRMGPLEQEGLAALADLGYRFSMDRAADLRVNFQALSARRFRYLKVPSDALLTPGKRGGDIAAADMADMLARFAIDLIVDGVDTEKQVVDLLEYKAPYGQGALFGPPRPVRADAEEPAQRAAS